jgi:hypothetical protein
MIVGIDFDNTIAFYDKLFHEFALLEELIDENWKGNSKVELRDYLFSNPNGKINWMKIQGLVYGKYMNQAELMPGVAYFIYSSIIRNHTVYIVSHKTKYGHYDDERYLLRDEAIKWMESKQFFNPKYFGLKKENIFFASTRYQKNEIIKNLNCDYFIDDLIEVFMEDNFPKNTRKILFSKATNRTYNNDIIQIDNWNSIKDKLYGNHDEYGTVMASLLLNHSVLNTKIIIGGGNSNVYKINDNDGSNYAMKCYPERISDTRCRLQTEVHTLDIFQRFNITYVPKNIKHNVDYNIAIYEWIDGNTIINPNIEDLRQTINFVKQLQGLAYKTKREEFQLASEACLSASELMKQIKKRHERLNLVGSVFPNLAKFLKNTFHPLLEVCRNKCLALWPIESQLESLPKNKQILSPSDFGFHNARKNENKLYFIDFEYFGWDDPVKMTADFLWHPAMDLKPELSDEWEKSMQHLFLGDHFFQKRLKAAMPLYGMRWVMIILNEYLSGFEEKRNGIGGVDGYNIEESRTLQLEKAKIYCEKVKTIIGNV